MNARSLCGETPPVLSTAHKLDLLPHTMPGVGECKTCQWAWMSAYAEHRTFACTLLSLVETHSPRHRITMQNCGWNGSALGPAGMLQHTILACHVLAEKMKAVLLSFLPYGSTHCYSHWISVSVSELYHCHGHRRGSVHVLCYKEWLLMSTCEIHFCHGTRSYWSLARGMH